jgi:phosphohistidine phosphatase
MLLYLLRHGDAIQDPSLNDAERPLSAAGKLQAATVGKFLQSNGVHIDVVLSSPLVRAVETADIVRSTIGIGRHELTEYLVPGTRKSQLIDLLNSTKPGAVLLVGHEPHLSQTISIFLSERESLPIEMKKCSLACLVASETIRSGHAMLQWLLTSEQMDLLNH